MKYNDLTWFEPMWRRLAVTAACVAWTAIEWWNGDALWGTLTSGLVAYCVWTLFINFKPGPPPNQDKTGDGAPPAA